RDDGGTSYNGGVRRHVVHRSAHRVISNNGGRSGAADVAGTLSERRSGAKKTENGNRVLHRIDPVRDAGDFRRAEIHRSPNAFGPFEGATFMWQSPFQSGADSAQVTRPHLLVSSKG